MIITTKKCDVCATQVKDFHNSAGNISQFDVAELCDDCWEFLDRVKDQFINDLEEARLNIVNKYIDRCKGEKLKNK